MFTYAACFTLWERLLRDRCLKPYRITPIHWLMARRRPWRTHVVSPYRRTRHLLLRFLCLHEAFILPFGVAIFLAQIPYFEHELSICTSATAYSGTLFSLRWSAMEYRRYQPPCARFIARDDPHSKCIKCLGFSHAREAVYGISKCTFCENLGLITLRSRLEACEKENPFFPVAPQRPPLPLVLDLGFGFWARGDGEWADRPRLFSPFLTWVCAREFTRWIPAWLSFS